VDTRLDNDITNTKEIKACQIIIMLHVHLLEEILTLPISRHWRPHFSKISLRFSSDFQFLFSMDSRAFWWKFSPRDGRSFLAMEVLSSRVWQDVSIIIPLLGSHEQDLFLRSCKVIILHLIPGNAKQSTCGVAVSSMNGFEVTGIGCQLNEQDFFMT